MFAGLLVLELRGFARRDGGVEVPHLEVIDIQGAAFEVSVPVKLPKVVLDGLHEGVVDLEGDVGTVECGLASGVVIASARQVDIGLDLVFECGSDGVPDRRELLEERLVDGPTERSVRFFEKDRDVRLREFDLRAVRFFDRREGEVGVRQHAVDVAWRPEHFAHLGQDLFDLRGAGV